jgi:trans-aconitate methyltransferase
MKKNETDNIPARFKWALEIIQPTPADRILEIGCGPGILTSMIATKLKTGQITAIDRSPSMIHAAKKRNASFIENGKAALIQASLEDWTSSASFDSVITFNVSMLWKKPAHTLPLIKQRLKTNGRLFTFYQPPKNTTEVDIRAIRLVFESRSLLIEDVLIKKMLPAPAGCIITTL